jgi:tetratricopeptide (TPR) repeat protein
MFTRSKHDRAGAINVRLLVSIFVIGVMLVGGAVLARKYVQGRQLQQAMQDGEAAYAAGDWKTASENFGRWLARRPDDVMILKKYAESLLRRADTDAGHLQQAAAAYRRLMRIPAAERAASEVGPLTDLELLKAIVPVFESMGEFNQALALAREHLDEHPDSAYAQFIEAEAEARLNRRAEALALLEELLAEPLPAEATQRTLVRAAALLVELRANAALEGVVSRAAARERFREVFPTLVAALDQVIEHAPDDPATADALVTKSVLLREKVRMEEGRDPVEAEALREASNALLKQALALVDDNPITYLLIANQWRQRAQLDKARAALAALDELSDEEIRAYFPNPGQWIVRRFMQVSPLVIEEADAEKSRALAEETLAALEERPERVAVLDKVVGLFLQAGDVARAREVLDEYVAAMQLQDVQPEQNVQVAYAKALVRRAEGNPQGVIAALEPVKDRYRQVAGLRAILIEAYRAVDKPSAIRELLADVQDPTLDETRVLVDDLLQRGRWAEVIAEVDRVPADELDADLQLDRIQATVALESGLGQTDALREQIPPLRTLRDAYPTEYRPYALLAAIYRSLGQVDDARAELEAAIANEADPVSATVALARIDADSGAIEQAEQRLQELVERYPEVAAPRLALADFHVRHEQPARANEVMATGIDALAPGAERRRLRIRLALRELVDPERTDAGKARLWALVEEDRGASPDAEVPEEQLYVEPRAALLALEETLAQPEVAQQLIDEIKAQPGDAADVQWRYAQARLLIAQDARGNRGEAEALLRTVVDDAPRWLAPVVVLGDLYRQDGRYESAENLYLRSLDRSPSAAVGLQLLGMYDELNRAEDRAALLQELEPVLDPDTVMLQRVRVAAAEGRLEDALAEVEQNVTGDLDAQRLVLRAELRYRETRDAAAALADLERALALDPDNVAIPVSKARILLTEDRIDEAEAVVKTFAEESDEPLAKLLLAQFYAETDQSTAAEETLTALHANQPSPLTTVVLARFYVQNDEPERGFAVWEEGVAAYPENEPLRRALVRAYLGRNADGDLAKAEAHLAELPSEPQGDVELLAIQALNHIRRDELDAARQVLAGAVDAGRSNAGTYRELAVMARGLANTYESRGLQAQRDAALELADEIAGRGLTFFPNNPALHTERARAEFQLGNDLTANAAAREALAEFEDIAPFDAATALEIRTRVAADADDRQELGLIQRQVANWIENYPMDGLFRVRAADVQVALGAPEAAIRDLRDYLVDREGEPDVARLALAQLLRDNGRPEEALTVLETARAIEPADANYFGVQLLALGDLKRYSAIISLVEAERDLLADNPALYGVAAGILSQSPPHMEAALQLAQERLDAEPPDSPARPFAMLELGDLNYRAGQKADARAIYREVVALRPDQPEALNNLAWMLGMPSEGGGQPDQLDEALGYAQRAVSLQPGNANFHDTLGNILLISGDQLGARAAFDQVLSLTSSNEPALRPLRARALLHLAQTYDPAVRGATVTRLVEQARELDRDGTIFTADEQAQLDDLAQRAVQPAQ